MKKWKDARGIMPKNEKFKKTNQNNEKTILSQKPYNNQKQAQKQWKWKAKLENNNIWKQNSKKM